jgi:ribosomal-protein-alanine N-acetyltransferase
MGIGEALVQQLTLDLMKLGSRCLTLEVRESNAPAIALYEKLGFRQVGKRPRYYEKPREDALILRKEWEI